MKVDTGTGVLLCSIEEGVATITLNRPEARNALGRRVGDLDLRDLALRGLDALPVSLR